MRTLAYSSLKMTNRPEAAAALSDHLTHASGRRKTVCTSAVLAHFGIAPSSYRYAENRKTVCSVLRRNGWSVRSRMSKLPKGCTIGQARKAIAKFSGKDSERFYVSVPGHAMLLDGKGRTVVDTAPRKRDRRRVLAITIVERKCAKVQEDDFTPCTGRHL